MLKRYNLYLNEKDVKELERIGQGIGGLKASQMIRLAISDYLKRERRSKPPVAHRVKGKK